MRSSRSRLSACLAALALAACGEEERPVAPGAAAGGTRLEIEVRPRGDEGPVRRRVVTDPPAGLGSRDLAPVAAGIACTELYGGPATATVRGRLRGREVDAAFNRTDGCQIARWDRLEALLGRVPGASPP